MTINPTLLNEYRRYRQHWPAGGPRYAIKCAREAMTPREGLPNGTASAVGYNSFFPASGIGAPFKVASDLCRWIEKPSDFGLRFVGYANKVAPRSVRRGGWSMDDDGCSGDVARGVVFQFPARNGRPRFVAGIADPYNDGPAVVSFDVTDCETTAAHWADQLAERYAEKERTCHEL